MYQMLLRIGKGIDRKRGYGFGVEKIQSTICVACLRAIDSRVSAGKDRLQGALRTENDWKLRQDIEDGLSVSMLEKSVLCWRVLDANFIVLS